MKGQTEEAKISTKNSVRRLVMVAIAVLLQVAWIIGLAVRLTKYYAAISTLASVLALLLVFRVYGLRINSAYKISWIILIELFPILGVCLYLMFGRTGALGTMRKWFDKVHTAYAHLLPQDEAIVDKLENANAGLARQSEYLRKGARISGISEYGCGILRGYSAGTGSAESRDAPGRRSLSLWNTMP